MKKGIAKIQTIAKNTTKIRGDDIIPHGMEEQSLLTHAIVKESLVEVELRLIAGERFVRVKVYSLVKPNLFRYSDIRVAGNSQEDMQRKCGMLGGTLAEQLIELYRDLVEPSHCAKMAGRHFAELCRVMAAQPSQEASVN